MGLSFRKTINLGKHVKMNLRKKGVSASVKVGNVTYNTKRGISANLGNGFTYRSNKKSEEKIVIVR